MCEQKSEINSAHSSCLRQEEKRCEGKIGRCGKKKKDVKEKLDSAVRRKLGTGGWRDAYQRARARGENGNVAPNF
jgi:hypothetical protein